MIKTILQNPFGRINVEFIQPAKNWYKELMEEVPELEVKTSYSSIDEKITREEDIDGNEIKATYLLKASEDKQKFKYEHTLTEEDNIEDIRNVAWAQLESWQYEQKQIKLNMNKTTEDGKEK
jgi:uncharacterized protein YfaS (alpha-2-macroglobulin family)